MSQKTKIQWCDSTVNPTMGCDGCELWNKTSKRCYAGKLHQRFGGVTRGYSPTFEKLTLWPGRMSQAANWSDLRGKKRPHKPWLNGMPRLIFVSDMSDSLSKAVTFKYLEKEIIANVTSPKGTRHCWLWLTKQPNRMAKFSKWLENKGLEWPQNLWAGTSITTNQSASRIPRLLEVGNHDTIRFLSVEPQWERIDLSEWLDQLSWIIQGGESGHEAKEFNVEWAHRLINDCNHHLIPYFLKQLGSKVTQGIDRIKFEDSHAGNWSEWPVSLQVREFPAVK